MRYIKDVFIIIVVFGLVQVYMQQEMRSGKLPQFSVQTIRGDDSARLLSNKPAIVYFWGSWCGICSTMQGTITNVLQDYAGVTIALRSGHHSDVLNYLDKNELDWPVINDNDGAWARKFGVTAVPAVFIVAANGEISFVSLGYASEIGLRLRLWWAGMQF